MNDSMKRLATVTKIMGQRNNLFEHRELLFRCPNIISEYSCLRLFRIMNPELYAYIRREVHDCSDILFKSDFLPFDAKENLSHLQTTTKRHCHSLAQSPPCAAPLSILTVATFLRSPEIPFREMPLLKLYLLFAGVFLLQPRTLPS